MKTFLMRTMVLCIAIPLAAFSLDEQFIEACKVGNLSKAEELLEQGAHIEARDGSDHQTGLVFSANAGHLSIVKMLIKRGAEINATDDKGWTALSEASYRGRTSIVAFLLEKKASTLPSTSWLDSREHGNALFWCIESTHNVYNEKIEIVKLLLAHGCEPEGVDENNRDSLTIAKHRNYTEIVQLLEKYRAERIAKQNKYALLEAIRKQDVKKVKLYLDKKVNPNSLLENGESLLNYAVSAQNIAIVKLLLEYGANPNTANELGTTALMRVIRAGNVKIFNLLIDYGINVNQTDLKGRTALFYAVENNSNNVLNTLLNSGISIDATDNYGATAFLYACTLGNIPACRMIMQSGCQISNADLYGNTALHIAAQKSIAVLARMLIENGNIDITAKNDNGRTALYYAQKNNNKEIIELLRNSNENDEIEDERHYEDKSGFEE